MSLNTTITSSPPATTEIADKSLEPFHVLHKASGRKPESKAAKTGKAKRKIELSPMTKLNKSGVDDGDDEKCDRLRVEACDFVWSRIESTIKGVLRKMNAGVFEEIYRWVSESFGAIKSSGSLDFAEATRHFPIVSDAACKQLFTGLVLTKNLESADDQMTFQDLSSHLKSQGCHVANLYSLDFVAKLGVGGSLRNLLRQFMNITLDAADMSILASWHIEHGNGNAPLVIIIADTERCCGSVLHDFICMLSEWGVKIPIILIMGIATTPNALRNLLPSNTLQHIHPVKFILGSPTERMDAVIEAVLLKQRSWFNISHKVAVSMKNYFLNHDGTLTSFIKALKIACIRHFSIEPLSVMLKPLLLEQESKNSKLGLSTDILVKITSELPSQLRSRIEEQMGQHFARCLLNLMRLQNNWSVVVQCLYETGKLRKMQLLDLFCEALDPNLGVSESSNNHTKVDKEIKIYASDQQCPALREGGNIHHALQIVRELPSALLFNLLDTWKRLTVEVDEIHQRVIELQSSLNIEDQKNLKHNVASTSRKHASPAAVRDTRTDNEKAARLLTWMIRNYMQPIESIPFHEIICFKNTQELSSALIGDPRRQVQVDLLQCHEKLNSFCGSSSANTPSPSSHDTSILYTMAQEHCDVINLHDWYQSFKTIGQSSSEGKRKSKKSQPSKKTKVTNESGESEASTQARFCRAVTELQVTGLLRMPSKRRPDYVQRVAFGL